MCPIVRLFNESADFSFRFFYRIKPRSLERERELSSKKSPKMKTMSSVAGRDDPLDDLPDKHVARDFYAKYEPKEVLGRGVSSTVRRCIEKETGKEFAAKIIDVSADLEDSQGECII